MNGLVEISLIQSYDLPFTGTSRIIEVTAVVYLFLGTGGLLENNLDFTLTNIVSFDTSFSPKPLLIRDSGCRYDPI